jgi:hypothetical protein
MVHLKNQWTKMPFQIPYFEIEGTEDKVSLD